MYSAIFYCAKLPRTGAGDSKIRWVSIADIRYSRLPSVAVFADEPEEIPAGEAEPESPFSWHAMIIAAGFRDLCPGRGSADPYVSQT
jgi:hypothetical protein